ncbi:MAG: putative homologous-pairing protein 2 [Streblomastix strix]|uniref:Putative homologous-pairing protein 2 n=1 Tax=Streblomastix strix TaxID=222440 RepID=A0A5J4WNE7_9EUKA|nr:MAG: putative homologous-pairing protein 2 [Streblomastix strix]
MPPKKKASKGVSKDDAEQVLLDYINKQNRPFSVQNLIDNLHGQVKKAVAQRALDSLAADSRIALKEFGKNKVYFADQTQFEVPSNERIEEIDENIQQAQNELAESEAERKGLEADNNVLQAEPTNEEVEIQTEKFKVQNADMRKRLDKLKEGGIKIDPEYKDRVSKNYGANIAEWKARRRACIDALSNIAEGSGKGQNELINELGIETDEAVGITLKDVEVEGIPKTAIAYLRQKPRIKVLLDQVLNEVEKQREKEQEEEQKRMEEEMAEKLKEYGGDEEMMRRMMMGDQGYTEMTGEEGRYNENDRELMEKDKEEGEKNKEEEETKPKKAKKAKKKTTSTGTAATKEQPASKGKKETKDTKEAKSAKQTSKSVKQTSKQASTPKKTAKSKKIAKDDDDEVKDVDNEAEFRVFDDLKDFNDDDQQRNEQSDDLLMDLQPKPKKRTRNDMEQENKQYPDAEYEQGTNEGVQYNDNQFNDDDTVDSEEEKIKKQKVKKKKKEEGDGTTPKKKARKRVKVEDDDD